MTEEVLLLTKLLSVTVNDKSKLEPILEFCQFAVEKGYYSDKHQLVPMYWQESVLEGKVHTV